MKFEPLQNFRQTAAKPVDEVVHQQHTNSEIYFVGDQSFTVGDPVSGRVRVRMWTKLHFRKAAKNQVNLILVERLKPTGSGRI
jgi:hypothetical protein